MFGLHQSCLDTFIKADQGFLLSAVGILDCCSHFL